MVRPFASRPIIVCTRLLSDGCRSPASRDALPCQAGGFPRASQAAQTWRQSGQSGLDFMEGDDSLFLLIHAPFH